MEPVQHRLRLVQPDNAANASQSEGIACASTSDREDWGRFVRRVLGTVRMEWSRRRIAFRQACLVMTNILFVRGFHRGIDLAQEVGRTPLHSHLSRAKRIFALPTGQLLPE